MISHKYKFIFVHVEKTGGNSIQSVLRKYSEDKLVLNNKKKGLGGGFELETKNLNINKHSTIKDYYSELNKEKFKDYFKFTCVRNPWDRAFSWYNFMLGRGVVKNKNLKSFLKEQELPNNQFDAISINDKIAVDFIMKFENLEEDFKKVCDQIGIHREKPPHLNKTEHKHYSKYYDVMTKELVSQLFKQEIKRFNYVFENKNPYLINLPGSLRSLIGYIVFFEFRILRILYIISKKLKEKSKTYSKIVNLIKR